jgi:hypothetical protein
MATKTTAVKTNPSTLTGADILAILNRNTAPERSLGDAVVDYTADKMNSLTTGVSRVSGAALEGFNNAGKHFALERSVQKARSDAKLRAAANRAADRLNALMA